MVLVTNIFNYTLEKTKSPEYFISGDFEIVKSKFFFIGEKFLFFERSLNVSLLAFGNKRYPNGYFRKIFPSCLRKLSFL